MSLRLVIACLLAAGAKAFAPAPIRLGGAVGKRFVLAPASRVSASMSPVHGPQTLTIRDQTSVTYGIEVPQFLAKSDNTIAWDGKGLCIEASGTSSGDMVQLNRCTGEATQTWNWLPWGPLQLHGTNQCLDATHNGGLNGAPIELRTCEHGVTDSWAFEDPAPLPTPMPASYFASARHVMMYLTAFAVLVFFGLGAHFYRLRHKEQSLPMRRVYLLDEGGVCLSAPMLRESIVAMTRRAEGSKQRMVPAVMALNGHGEQPWRWQQRTHRPARPTDMRPDVIDVNYEYEDNAVDSAKKFIDTGVSKAQQWAKGPLDKLGQLKDQVLHPRDTPYTERPWAPQQPQRVDRFSNRGADRAKEFIGTGVSKAQQWAKGPLDKLGQLKEQVLHPRDTPYTERPWAPQQPQRVDRFSNRGARSDEMMMSPFSRMPPPNRRQSRAPGMHGMGGIFGAMDQMMDEMTAMPGGPEGAMDPGGLAGQMMRMGGPGGGGSFSVQTTMVSSRVGEDGQRLTERFASRAVGDRARNISEVQQAYSNSATGMDRMSWERRMADRGRRMVRERNNMTGDDHDYDLFHGMAEDQIADFDRQWQQDAAPYLPRHPYRGQLRAGRDWQALSPDSQPYREWW